MSLNIYAIISCSRYPRVFCFDRSLHYHICMPLFAWKLSMQVVFWWEATILRYAGAIQLSMAAVWGLDDIYLETAQESQMLKREADLLRSSLFDQRLLLSSFGCGRSGHPRWPGTGQAQEIAPNYPGYWSHRGVIPNLFWSFTDAQTFPELDRINHKLELSCALT